MVGWVEEERVVVAEDWVEVGLVGAEMAVEALVGVRAEEGRAVGWVEEERVVG